VSCRLRECNWVQALEGDIDPSHFSFLHTGAVNVADIDPSHPERFSVITRAPRYQVQQTDWGLMYASHRPADPGNLYYRYAHFALPFWTMFPNGPLSDNILAQAWVPMDDTHTMTFTALWKRKTPPLEFTKDGTRIPGVDRMCETLPNTADWLGRWRLTANQSNDYLIDREAQRSESYTGILGRRAAGCGGHREYGWDQRPHARNLGTKRPDDRDDPPAAGRRRPRIARPWDGAGSCRSPGDVRHGSRGRLRRARRQALARSLRGNTGPGIAAGYAARGGVRQ
jgi:hypothetical protein